MKRRDMTVIVFVAIFSGLISMFIAGLVFNPPSSRVKVPIVDKIDPSFPDVKNDSNYSVFLNTSALDPTLPIQIGDTKNTQPFNSAD